MRKEAAESGMGTDFKRATWRAVSMEFWVCARVGIVGFACARGVGEAVSLRPPDSSSSAN